MGTQFAVVDSSQHRPRYESPPPISKRIDAGLVDILNPHQKLTELVYDRYPERCRSDVRGSSLSILLDDECRKCSCSTT